LTKQDYDAVISRVTDILGSDLCDVTEMAFLYGSTCVGEVVPGLSDIDFAVVCKGNEVEIDVMRRYADAFRPVLCDPRTRSIWYRPFMLYNSRGFRAILESRGSYLFFLRSTGRQIFGPKAKLPEPDIDRVRKELVERVTSFEKYGYLVNEFFRCWESAFLEKRMFSTLEHSLVADGQSISAAMGKEIPVLRPEIYKVLEEHAAEIGDPDLPGEVWKKRSSWGKWSPRIEYLQDLYLRTVRFYLGTFRLLKKSSGDLTCNS